MFIEEYIQRKVKRLIKKAGTSNPEGIIKTRLKSVDFKYVPLCKNINGYYIYISGKKKIIRVNSALKGAEKQFVVLHETGHCILDHRGIILLDRSNSINKLKEEYDADLFAACSFKIYNNINKFNLNNFCMPEYIKSLVNKFL